MIPLEAKYAVVVAVTHDWGIGCDNKLPWHPRRLHLDMSFLKFITTHNYSLIPELGGMEFLSDATRNAVIMGRKTWESIPAKFRPMQGCQNVVVTSRPEDLHSSYGSDVLATTTFADALSRSSQSTIRAYVLGGSSIYQAALNDSNCEAVFITRLKRQPHLPCDVFFPEPLLKLHYRFFRNVSQDVWKLLHGLLSANSNAELDSTGDFINEGDISYSIELWIRNP